MFVALLEFRRTWYDWDGESSRTDTVTVEAETREILNNLVNKAIKDNVGTDYGDFGMMTRNVELLSTRILKEDN